VNPDFAAVILSMTVLNGMNDNNLGVFTVLAVGGAVGFVNGVVHVRLKVPSFMATLGSWFIGVGVANALLGGMAIRINDPMIRGLAIRRALGFPWSVWLALACLAIAFVIQNHTRLGRYIYARGGGEELAALCGISVSWVRIVTFSLRASSIRWAGSCRRRNLVLATRSSATVAFSPR
jgi:ribose transport system permease protein